MPSTNLVAGSLLGAKQFRKHRLARDGGLPLADQRQCSGRQIDVGPRAEPDQADALSRTQSLTLVDEAHDPPRNQAGDLYNRNAGPIGRGDDQRIALIVLASLVEARVEGQALMIHDPFDPADNRAAVYVTVEYAHEDRDANERRRPEPQIRRR